jgi:sialate O-acetylesterase
MRSFVFCSAVIVFLLPGSVIGAELLLPSYFGDNMVFQREKPISIWGTAAAGESVTVQLAEHKACASAGSDGAWQVQLPAMNAGGPHEMVVSGAAQQKKISGVYIGDVWVFSGQSNMQVSFDYFLGLPNIAEEYKKQFSETLSTCSQHRLVRHYMVASRDRKGQTIRNTAENRWFYGDREAVKHCNPVAYYFAQTVSKRTGVMTAAVRLAWGGQYIERFYKGADISEYMIKPWGNFPVKGVIWYQGENNLHKDGDRLGYALKLQMLVNDYRTLWNDTKLPFYIVQLPPAKYSDRPFNDENSLPVFLEAQRQALAIPFTAMANTADLGMTNGLHQPQKYEVAMRLANLAFANAYGFADAVPAGPQYKKYEREGNKLKVYFETFGSGLITKDGQAPRYFEVLGEGSQAFAAAEAKIEGDGVLVWSDEVAKPVDVRFAFREQDLMDINLTNEAHIPAATFWAGATNQLHPGLLAEMSKP